MQSRVLPPRSGFQPTWARWWGSDGSHTGRIGMPAARTIGLVSSLYLVRVRVRVRARVRVRVKVRVWVRVS